jgi:hypothetical protein
MDAGVMAEPQWPRCPSCDAELEERIDPKTGKVVREGGRAMLQCPRCGAISIGPSPVSQRRRYLAVRVTLSVSAFLASVGVLAWKVAEYRGQQGFSSPGVWIGLIVLAGAATAAHMALDNAAAAISPNRADARLNAGALALFYAVIAGAGVWLTVTVAWPLTNPAPSRQRR